MATDERIWNINSSAAFIEATRRIEEAQLKVSDTLDFGGLGALQALPPNISNLSNLRSLYLYNTLIDNITPIAELTNLKMIFIDNTKVKNIDPVSKITGLRILSLNKTEVSDINPISKLKNLHGLHIKNTNIKTLQPIKGMNSLSKAARGKSQLHGLHYAGTPVAARDIFRNLVALNQPECTIQTLQYLDGTHPLYNGSTYTELLANPPAEAIARRKKIDLDPAPPGDEPGDADDRELATLPRRQQNLADQITDSLGKNLPTTRRALEQYREELSRPQTEIILEIFKEAYLTAKAGIEQARREGALDDDALAAWDQFDANHGTYLAHFPFDAAREHLYRNAPVDMDKANPAAVAKAFADFLDTLNNEEVAKIVGPRLLDWAENSADFSCVIMDIAQNAAARGDIPDEDMPHRVYLRRQVAQGWVMMVKIDAFLKTDKGKVIKNVTEFSAAVIGLSTILGAMFL